MTEIYIEEIIQYQNSLYNNMKIKTINQLVIILIKPK
jgi:hypothetical protein